MGWDSYFTGQIFFILVRYSQTLPVTFSFLGFTIQLRTFYTFIWFFRISNVLYLWFLHFKKKKYKKKCLIKSCLSIYCLSVCFSGKNAIFSHSYNPKFLHRTKDIGLPPISTTLKTGYEMKITCFVH